LIYISVEKEGPEPVINLQKSNFGVKLSGATPPSFSLKRYYSSAYSRFIYEIQVSSIGALPSSVEVTLQDTRGIKTVSYTTSIRQSSE